MPSVTFYATIVQCCSDVKNVYMCTSVHYEIDVHLDIMYNGHIQKGYKDG